MKQSHKTFLNEAITKMTTHITTQRHLEIGEDVQIKILWASVYTEEEYKQWKGYKIAIKCDLYSSCTIEVESQEEIHEILDYINGLVSIMQDDFYSYKQVYTYTMKGEKQDTHCIGCKPNKQQPTNQQGHKMEKIKMNKQQLQNVIDNNDLLISIIKSLEYFGDPTEKAKNALELINNNQKLLRSKIQGK